MVIEIKGTGSHNKGAEMMLLTLLEELKNDNVIFTTKPIRGSCDYAFYSKLGIFPKIWIDYKGIQLGKYANIIPKKIRNLFGLISDNEVDVILDASGFVYSSQWGTEPTKLMAKETKRWKKLGKKIILLPQAFGPFDNDDIKQYMYDIIENSNIIYARDKFSYNELIKIKNDEKIKLFPDFTSLFKGEIPNYFDKTIHQVCIVPNQRMKDKTNNSDNYEEFFSKIIMKLKSNNLSPFFLIHGGEEDRKIAEKINMLLNDKISILSEEDPYLIKGIIENSIGLIGSRFHSIASALYSGIPTIGTGWSHKYQYLFEEFNFNEGLIDITLSDEELYYKLEMITNNESRKQIKQQFLKKRQEINAKTIKMFQELKSEINLI